MASQHRGERGDKPPARENALGRLQTLIVQCLMQKCPDHLEHYVGEIVGGHGSHEVPWCSECLETAKAGVNSAKVRLAASA